MKKIKKRQKGWTLTELTTAVTIGVLVMALSLPLLFRFMNNLKEQSIIATLWTLFEAQKDYRDNQTPTTYANNLTQLQPYVTFDNPRYGVTFDVASATANTFILEAKNTRGACFTINESAIIGTSCGGSEGGGDDGGGDPPPDDGGGGGGGGGGGKTEDVAEPDPLPSTPP